MDQALEGCAVEADAYFLHLTIFGLDITKSLSQFCEFQVEKTELQRLNDEQEEKLRALKNPSGPWFCCHTHYKPVKMLDSGRIQEIHTRMVKHSDVSMIVPMVSERRAEEIAVEVERILLSFYCGPR